jgi:translation initiation factor IF-3
VGSTGEQLGVIKLNDALRKAQSLGLDLVEIAPTATPPVCKIIDFGKFRYDISKHTKDKRPSGSKLKEIKFRVNIDDHDYLTKIRHGEEFLDRGNKVRVQLQFRGREMAHQEFGMQLVHKVRDDLAGMSQVEMEPKNRRTQYHHDPGTSACEPPEEAIYWRTAQDRGRAGTRYFA